jgi:hypothetical protein
MKEEKICSIEGCEAPYYSKDLCNKHYTREYVVKRRNKQEKICSMEGCVGTYWAKGLCKNHYTRNYEAKKKANKEPKICVTPNCGRKAYKYDICIKCKKVGRFYTHRIYLKGNPEVHLEEIKRVLTKWKWGYIDELLYFRTLDLYLKIWEWNRKIEYVDIDKVMRFILKELKDFVDKKKPLKVMETENLTGVK